MDDLGIGYAIIRLIMIKIPKNYILAIFTLVGMTMGVGMLSVPYTIYQAGVLPVIGYFLGLGAITLFINLAYGELNLRTEGKHRLIGFIRKYLGNKYFRISTVTSTFSIWGALLAYILVGGKYLTLMFGGLGGNELFYQTIFFVIFAFLITRGLRRMAEVNFALSALKVILLIGFVIFYSRFIDTANYVAVDWPNIFFPYGIILFAIGGSAAVPEMRDILGSRGENKLKPAIIWGTLISVSLIALWGFVVAGIMGAGTTDESIVGLAGELGGAVALIGSTFGFLLVATAFLVLGENLMEQFRYDLSIKYKWLAAGLALIVPFVFLLIVKPNLVQVISITGAVFGAVDLVFLICAYLKSRKTTPLPAALYIKHALLWGGIALVIFKLGAIYELYFTFFAR